MSNLDEELYNAYVSEEFRKSANEVKDEIDKKINDYLGEFRAYLDSVCAQLEQKNYQQQFAQESQQVIERTEVARQRSEEIAKLCKEIEQQAPGLKEQVAQLSDANRALETELVRINQQASGIGQNIGKFIASNLKSVITGGIKIF
ncbi:hypothetical protein JCM19232_5991 [Vibrio ishigakensis]|uniref:Uncharacterized protein n=1 Tax=Vibrio ishigakensis TaxID=1481914 RepID=A0A0B8P4I9_9VIBR|nr:hypothetical protein JCM19232_5991 [Vibrio ishigakensis]